MKNKSENLRYKYFKPLKALIIILMLVFSLQILPAIAQSNKYPVDIDGRQIFRVSSTEDTPAIQRAEKIKFVISS